MLHSIAGKNKLLIIIGLAVVVVAGVAVVTVTGGRAKGAKTEKGHTQTAEMNLGQFVVTLADSPQVRYLKTDIVLEVAGKLPEGHGGGHGGEAKAPAPIRDAVIEVLSSKTLAQLNRPGGRETLKESLILCINNRLDKGTQVKNVFFNEFAMQ